MDLALNNLQRLIYHKTHQTKPECEKIKNLIDKHFLATNKFHKIFDKNAIEINYSWIDYIISNVS